MYDRSEYVASTSGVTTLFLIVFVCIGTIWSPQMFIVNQERTTTKQACFRNLPQCRKSLVLNVRTLFLKANFSFTR